MNLILLQYKYYTLLEVLFNTILILISCIVCIVNNITKYDEWRISEHHLRGITSSPMHISDALNFYWKYSTVEGISADESTSTWRNVKLNCCCWLLDNVFIDWNLESFWFSFRTCSLVPCTAASSHIGTSVISSYIYMK